tara:strand:+ start:424 stop:981 length:558 start_codon:yes stop_codon:yes gene_type:complete
MWSGKSSIIALTITLYVVYAGAIIFGIIGTLVDFDILKTCAMGRLILFVNLLGTFVTPIALLYILTFIKKRKFVKSHISFDIINIVLFLSGLIAVCFKPNTCVSSMQIYNVIILNTSTWVSMCVIAIRIVDEITNLCSVSHLPREPLLRLDPESDLEKGKQTDDQYNTTQEYVVENRRTTTATVL